MLRSRGAVLINFDRSTVSVDVNNNNKEKDEVMCDATGEKKKNNPVSYTFRRHPWKLSGTDTEFSVE